MSFIESRGAPLGRLLQYPGFTRFLSARLLASIAVQMQTVAVGWQVYAITGDPLDLGLIGLSQFLPFVLLVLPAGHIADRHNRARDPRAVHRARVLLRARAARLHAVRARGRLAGVRRDGRLRRRARVLDAGRAGDHAEPRAAVAVLARRRGELEHLAGLDDRRARDRRARLPRRPGHRLCDGRGTARRGSC